MIVKMLFETKIGSIADILFYIIIYYFRPWCGGMRSEKKALRRHMVKFLFRVLRSSKFTSVQLSLSTVDF